MHWTQKVELDGKNIICAVGCNSNTGFFLTDKGELYINGQLMYFAEGDSHKPLRLLEAEHVLQIAASNQNNRAMVLTRTKLIEIGACWGENDKDGIITSPHFRPHDIKKVQMGGIGSNDHCTVLLHNGDLYSMGVACYHNELGREGVHHTFELVATNVEDVWAGGWHTHLTKRDGTLHAFGFNYDGRCGIGNTEPLLAPAEAKSHTYIAGTSRCISIFVRMKGLEDVFVTRIVSGVYKILTLSQTGKLFLSDAMMENKEAEELKEFGDKRVVDIGVSGSATHAILLWE